MTVKNVFTIAPVFSFADTLAAELLNRHADTPSELAKTVLFLPTRRACKTVQEAFLRQSGGRPLMLVCRTVKGKGVSYMENQVGWHG
ncbi:MAG: hypothetical protein ACI4TE_05485, partial [Alphaproteobacteria bacterium]